MKKILVIIVLFVTSNSTYGEKLFNQKYLDDLKKKPLELTDLEAQRLMDNPGLRDTISTYYVYAKEPGFSGSIQEAYPKMSADKFMLFPWSGKITTKYIARIIWYDPKWKYDHGWREEPVIITKEDDGGLRSLASFYCIMAFVVVLIPRIWLLGEYFLPFVFKDEPSWETVTKLWDRNRRSGLRYTAALMLGCGCVFVIHPVLPLRGDPLGYSIMLWVCLPLVLLFARGLITNVLLKAFRFTDYYLKRCCELSAFMHGI